jgi:UDP-N-acetyl-D-glucosamine dehydrogenase
LGIAYKKNVDDVRESPALEIMELLQKKGVEIAYSDPYLPAFPRMREHHFDLKSVPLTAQSLAAYDCVLLTTAHDQFDFDFIKQYARLIVDTRGVYREAASHIIKA